MSDRDSDDAIELMPEDSGEEHCADDDEDHFGTPEGDFERGLKSYTSDKGVSVSSTDRECENVYRWVGELLDVVPALRAANAHWMAEWQVLQDKLHEERTEHDLELKKCREQAEADLASVKQGFEREREGWKRCHKQEMEIERQERLRLEARIMVLEAEVTMLQTQKTQQQDSFSRILDSKTRELASSAKEIEELIALLGTSKAAAEEARQEARQLQLEAAQSLASKQQEVDRLRVHVASQKSHLHALEAQQERCTRATKLALSVSDPERLYRRPPMLDACGMSATDSLLPGAYSLWQAWWTCPASARASAESFEWHMAQLVRRYFGQQFVVSQTGGSRDGGVDLWVQTRRVACHSGGADSHSSKRVHDVGPGSHATPPVYECAVQVKRYQAPLSDASIREFAEKVGVRAKRAIFIAPGGFGKSAQSYAEGKGSWLGEDKAGWMELWDAHALRKLLLDFGDDWCKSVLASCPSARHTVAKRAALHPPSTRAALCVQGREVEAGYDMAARSGEGKGARDAWAGETGMDSSHGSADGNKEAGEEEAGAEPSARQHVDKTASTAGEQPVAAAETQLAATADGAARASLCRIAGCNCNRRKAGGGDASPWQAAESGWQAAASAGPDSFVAAVSGTSVRTPLKAGPARLNVDGGSSSWSCVLSEQRSSKKVKFDEAEVPP